MPKPKKVDTTPAKGTAEVSKKFYEVGRGKPPKATRFQKGKSGNPKGRPKKKQEDFDPGKILQTIDNEQAPFDGRRKLMKRAEIVFRNLFLDAIDGSFAAASVIKKSAEEYFGPAAEAPSQPVFIVKRDDGSLIPPRLPPRQRGMEMPVSAGSLFRRVARHPVKVDGHIMTAWEAYIRQVHEMANENKRAAQLLQQLRKLFPGDAPPGETITFLITEADANL
jgi:hypothetical protein